MFWGFYILALLQPYHYLWNKSYNLLSWRRPSGRGARYSSREAAVNIAPWALTSATLTITWELRQHCFIDAVFIFCNPCSWRCIELALHRGRGARYCSREAADNIAPWALTSATLTISWEVSQHCYTNEIFTLCNLRSWRCIELALRGPGFLCAFRRFRNTGSPPTAFIFKFYSHLLA